MRWHVYGTDAVTAQPAVLTIEAESAAAAVQAALSRQILVQRAARASRIGLRGIALTASTVAAILLAGAVGVIHWREQDARSQLAAAQAEEARLAADLTDSGENIAALQRRTVALEQAQGGAAKQLVDQLEAARSEMQATAERLSAAQSRANELEKKAAATGKLNLELAAAQSQVAELSRQVQTERLHIAELGKARAALAAAEKSNRELAAQVDVLKTQLLDQAAKSLIVPVAQPAEPAPAAVHRWALRTEYDAAADFLTLHFDKNAAASAPAGDAVATTGVLAANASTLRLLHDREKKSVYSATLSISLAADGPKQKLAENQRLLADFIQQFAPGFKDADAWTADAARQLAGKDAAEKIVHTGDDFKITVWNDRLGLYTWKIESPRSDLDE